MLAGLRHVWHLAPNLLARAVREANAQVPRGVRVTDEPSAGTEPDVRPDADVPPAFAEGCAGSLVSQTRLLEALRTSEHLSFWSARALIEIWGPTDPDTVPLFEQLMEGSSKQVEMIAEYLPQVIADRARVRNALLRCLTAPSERADFVLAGLRQIGVAEDDEIFNAAWSAQDKLKGGPLYRDLWCAELISTFPKRPAVRALVLEEIRSHDGRVGAIAESFADDPKILTELLRTVSPLSESARFQLVRHLQGIAEVAAEPLALLAGARDDGDGLVRTEAMLMWTDTVAARGPVPEHEVDRIIAELSALGPIYEQRRAAAAVALLSIGKFSAVVASEDHKNEPRKYSIGQHSFREDDRFLRSALEHWEEAVRSMGDEQTALQRLGIDPYSALELLEPGIPQAEHLFDLLYPAALTHPHLSLHVPLERAALFRPKSETVRELALSILLSKNVGETPTERFRDTYKAELSAGRVIAEQFGHDRHIIETLMAECRRDPRTVSVPAALAEIYLRHPDPQLKDFILQHAPGRRIDLANYLRILAAVSSPDRIVDEIEQFLSSEPKDEYVFRLLRSPLKDSDEADGGRIQGTPARWLPSVLRRAQTDEELRSEMWNVLQSSDHPSFKTSFALLLKRSGYGEKAYYAFISEPLQATLNANYPEVGYDLFSATYRPLRHVFHEVLE